MRYRTTQSCHLLNATNVSISEMSRLPSFLPQVVPSIGRNHHGGIQLNSSSEISQCFALWTVRPDKFSLQKLADSIGHLDSGIIENYPVQRINGTKMIG
jgi:hypothetical protein